MMVVTYDGDDLWWCWIDSSANCCMLKQSLMRVSCGSVFLLALKY